MTTHDEIIKNVWPEWKLQKLIGRGAYGSVYQAVREDHGLISYAAIKIIPIPQDLGEVDALRSEGMSDEETRAYYAQLMEDFTNEIRMLVSLKGAPHIVSIEDFKVIEHPVDFHWDILIRMELLTPFLIYEKGKTISKEDVVRLGVELCSALEICHAQNVIHRDVKPQNIFVDRFGSFKLGDFGIARKMEGMTGGLSQKGTYGYIAPEVSHSLRYDKRADIYSVGLVLYQQMNEGRLPFLESAEMARNPQCRTQALQRRLEGEELPKPCEADEELSDIILKACRYKPNERYNDIGEMRKVLQRLLVIYQLNEEGDSLQTNGAAVAENEVYDDERTYSARRDMDTGIVHPFVTKETENKKKQDIPKRNKEKIRPSNIKKPAQILSNDSMGSEHRNILRDHKKEMKIVLATIVSILMISSIALVISQSIKRKAYVGSEDESAYTIADETTNQNQNNLQNEHTEPTSVNDLEASKTENDDGEKKEESIPEYQILQEKFETYWECVYDLSSWIGFESRFGSGSPIIKVTQGSLKIEANQPSRALYGKSVKIKKNTFYRVKAKIKVENYKHAPQKDMNLYTEPSGVSVYCCNRGEFPSYNHNYVRNNEWTDSIIVFDSKERTTIDVGVMYGNLEEGKMTGTAYIKDLVVEEFHGDIAVLDGSESVKGYSSGKLAAKAIGGAIVYKMHLISGSEQYHVGLNENAESLIDHNTETKYFTEVMPCEVVFGLDSAIKPIGIVFGTANDHYWTEGGLPYLWSLFGITENGSEIEIISKDASVLKRGAGNKVYMVVKIDTDYSFAKYKFKVWGTSNGSFQMTDIMLCKSNG